MAERLILDVNGRKYSVSQKGTSIGRKPGNTIVLSDDEVSRHHADVWLRDGMAFVCDSGSKNGTFLNGKKLEGEHAINSGDQIRVGNTTIVVRFGMGSIMTSNLMWIILALVFGVLAVVGVTGYYFLNTNPPPPPQGALATVLISDLTNTPIGSGTLVDPRGFLLTRNSTLPGGGMNGCVPSIPATTILVGLVPEIERAPETFYQASLICADKGADLALLRIVATGGGGPLPSDLVFPYAMRGNSNVFQVGQKVRVFGFPAAGAPMTVREGVVSGFLPGAQGPTTFVTSSANDVLPGMYGGLVLNESNQMVGMILQPDGACLPTCIMPIGNAPARGLLEQMK